MLTVRALLVAVGSLAVCFGLSLAVLGVERRVAVPQGTTTRAADTKSSTDLPPAGGDEVNGVRTTTTDFILPRTNTSPSAVLTVKGYAIEPVIFRGPQGKAVVRRMRWLLPQMASSLDPSAKLVFIDLGARMFHKGSTAKFARAYPNASQFHAVAFELLDLSDGYGPARKFFRSFEYIRSAAWIHDRGVQIKGKKMARVVDGLNPIKGDDRSEWPSPSVDFAAFLRDRYTEKDFVVVKLDIEGGEWSLIPHLISTGAIRLVDEMLFECHPKDFAEYATVAHGSIPQSCVDLMNHLRVLGVFCHRWF